MGCSEFLERYSDFRDGLIADPRARQRLHRHVKHCPRCKKYDALLTRAVRALRTTSNLEPSSEFHWELQQRLERVRDVQELITPAPPALMAGLMMAAAVALLIWEGAVRPDDRAVTASAPAPERPRPVVIANPGMPFVSFADLTVPAFGDDWHVSEVEERTFATRTALSR